MPKLYITVAADKIRPLLMPKVPVLLPASSWYRRARNATKTMLKPNLPEHIVDRAADSGGYVAMKNWGGEYRYGIPQFVDWLGLWCPDWSAMMDYPCEVDLTEGKTEVVYSRQQRTTEKAWQTWEEYRDVPWRWVPTIQGWEVHEYERHAREMLPLLREMRSHYGQLTVGIGTLCCREKTAEIQQITRAVSAVFDAEYSLHLWGIKLGYFKSSLAPHPCVISTDTAAWDGLTGPRDRQVWQDNYRGKLTQSEYSWKIALPVYLDKVDRALSKPKQTSIFDL